MPWPSDRRESAGAWYDLLTGGNGSPDGRERFIALEETMERNRKPVEDRPARAHPSQAASDSQPARKRAARYRREIHAVKQLAAAPLRPARIAAPKPVDPTEPTLF